MSEYLTAVRIGSIQNRYPHSRLRNAIAQEEVAVGLVDRDELQFDRLRKRESLHDRQALPRARDLWGDRQEQLVHEPLLEQCGVQMWAPLAEQRPHALRAQIREPGRRVRHQANGLRR